MNTEDIKVNVYTRWHHIALLTSLILTATLITVLSQTPMDWFMILATTLVVSSSPLLIAFFGFPLRQQMSIHAEALVFERYGRIAFEQISHYAIDDKLIISRYAAPRLFIQPDNANFTTLTQQLVSALHSWQQHRTVTTKRPSAFYGSLSARLLGLILFLGASGVATINLLQPTTHHFIWLAVALGIGFGLPLLLGKRPY